MKRGSHRHTETLKQPTEFRKPEANAHSKIEANKMEVNESEIQVRALTGELTIVSVSPNATISHLKNLLKLRFPPAFSVDFHLFFKGVKLSAQSKVPAVSLDCGEFLVLIPFVKKDARQKDITGTDIPCNEDRQGQVSSFADSVYSDMMQEFSTLTENSSSASPMCDSEPCSMFSGYKRRKVIGNDNEGDGGGTYGFLWSVLRSPSKNIMEGKNCEEFLEVLESLSCLKNPYSGKCVLFDDSETVACGDSSEVLCLCPEWLKQIMGGFAFLNIFSAFLQLRRKEITCACLKEALKELQKFGFRAGFEDVEHLPVLCPKVVSFANRYTRITSSGGSLVIINCETEESDETENHPRNEGKSSSFSMIFSAVKKRESTFQTYLWKAAKRLLHKSGDRNMMLFSLEDLIKFVKSGGVSATKNEAKRAKTSPPSAPSSYSIRTQCHETNQFLPMEMIQHLKEGIGSKGQMVHIEDINARKATYVEIPHELSNNTKAALKYMGISKLYSHQAESILASLAGKNVVVATMTSSGKSLCYNVPVLEVLSQNLSSCALYLFPTKALAQDQLRALLAMGKGFHSSINIGVYDGDTTQKDRTLLRSNARLLITNPDMLHMSILPYHRQFSRILSNLRFVVIDEAHAYKGAFGCHTALILRRLRRLCSHVYGSDPSFVFSTATSANPREHCMELANLSTLELIKNDGSPSSQKLFVLWNPSYLRAVPHESGIGESHSSLSKPADKSMSPISEVSYLFAEMVQHGLRCIAFCKSRKLTELVLSYTREILQKTAPHLADLICAYRAGYTAEDRRKLEQEFFCGKLCGIAATNALELGIDVGHIDATLHLGFPGSISSLWQQAGRSGRRERQSLAVYVAFEGPLDQYFMKFPRKLFGGPIECCHIDAQNQQVLEQHLVCAALEHPVSLVYDEKYFGSTLNNALMSLRNRRELSYDPSHDSSTRIWSYIGREKAPSRGICIRAIEAVRYRVIDMQRSEVLEEIEESKAFFQVYEGAVYMHQGKTYLVKELDVSEKIASCHEAVLHYYTKTRDYTDIHVVGGDIAYPERSSKNQCSKTTAQANSCKVTTTWFGYRCIQRGSNKVLDTFDLSLPEYSYDSQAVWVRVPPSIKKSVEERIFSFRGGLHAASHALINVVPLFVRCNSSDLAPECPNPHDARNFAERILVYDQHPGGTGVSMQIQPYFTELLNAALELLTSCRCSGDTGCPNCVQSVVCQEYNEVIHKDAAIMIIKGVLDAESSYLAEVHNSSQKPKDVSPDIHIGGTS